MMKSMKIAISLMACALVVVGCGSAVDAVRETEDQKVTCVDYWAVASYPQGDMADLSLHIEAAAHDDSKNIEEKASTYVREGANGPEVVAGCFVPGYVLFVRQQ